jgi:hypothetical protein
MILGQKHGTRENQHGSENDPPPVVVKKMGEKEMAVLSKDKPDTDQEKRPP